MGLGFATIAAALLAADGLPAGFVVGLLLFGLGFGAAITPGTVLILDGLPAERRSVAGAVNDITREVGGVLGIAVLSSVLSSRTGHAGRHRNGGRPMITATALPTRPGDFGVRRSGTDGPLVVCLNGFPDDSSTFDGLAASLVDAGFRVAAVSLRGYSPSPLVGSLDLGDLVEEVMAVVDALSPAGPVALIGHDYGAQLGYPALAAAPHRFSSAVLLAGAHVKRTLAASMPAPVAMYRGSGFTVPEEEISVPTLHLCGADDDVPCPSSRTGRRRCSAAVTAPRSGRAPATSPISNTPNARPPP